MMMPLPNDQVHQAVTCLVYLTFLPHLVLALTRHDCDKVFSSYKTDSKHGTFQSPSYPNNYPNGVSCKYKFIAQDGEKVQIKFTHFALQGRPPACEFDFINIYSQLETESDDLLEADMTGPFCGDGKDMLPKLVISTFNYIIIWFHSNKEKSNEGFNGTWDFVRSASSVSVTDKKNAQNIGNCGIITQAPGGGTGNLLSATYPGVYPDNLFCEFRLNANRRQRIKLTFQDFSLFYGGEYCPFDFLRIHDGNSTNSSVIGKFCGNFNKSTIIFSTGNALMLVFITGRDRLNFTANPMAIGADFKFERRGFNISYEFSGRFVQLDDAFVRAGSVHVRGTECDLRILSNVESKGKFCSPGYPSKFPEGIVCRYFLDGLMNSQHLEKVKVTFFDFHIPGNGPYCLLGYLGENEDNRMDEGRIKQKYCGKLNPPNITSNGPRMVITLNTTDARQGGKFFADYQFITDYGIDGKQVEEGMCKYHYSGYKTKRGFTNSPRHPNVYPLNLNCEYFFRPMEKQFVVISFEVFTLSDVDNPPCNTGDYVAIYENVGTGKRANFSLSEKYCGRYYPGPYVTNQLVKMVFHSDSRHGFGGFKANYIFIRNNDPKLSCKTYRINAKGSGGIIQSPNYPGKYPALCRCEWIITASKKENRILVELMDVSLQGTYYGGDGERSDCEEVVLRLFNDSTTVQPVATLCGKITSSDANTAFMSTWDSFKVTFVSSPSSLGAKGFKISWTEIHDTKHATDCPGFECKKNKYCIAKQLKCNKVPNCGEGDDSDETAECPKTSEVKILHIAIGTSISSFFCIILLICGFYHRRKFRTERAPPDHDHVEVRYVSAPTGCNTTDRLLMDDRNDNTISTENHNHSSTTQSPRCQKVSMV